MVLRGRERVGEAPVCPARGGGEGGPPVGGDLGGWGTGEEGDEFDVAAVWEEDEGVCGGGMVSGMSRLWLRLWFCVGDWRVGTEDGACEQVRGMYVEMSWGREDMVFFQLMMGVEEGDKLSYGILCYWR